ncbi:hypothetical protein [Legionella geestiana]|uniref:hypothetical protein n=1 Tax=Legionella geestiana TaxID=45065 RepID=UPI001F5FEC54|nr:hypothetical protein [Legionella geestiana]
MKPYRQITEDTGIPQSTLERYIKELADDGFIERRQALYSRTSEEGAFTVKKGNYIHVTDKLIQLLQPSMPDIGDNEPDSTNDNSEHAPQDNSSAPDTNNTSADCVFSNPNEGIEPLKIRESYIGDLHSLVNNTIISSKLMQSVDKHTAQRLLRQFESIQTFLFSTIKEEISDEIKKLVAGTFFNLSVVHHQNLSCPEQVVSEYLFALLNTQFYMPAIQCFKHRNNILAKLIRAKNWRTPKGFFKHFYMGQAFKKTQSPEKATSNDHVQSIVGNSAKDPRLSKIEELIFEKGSLVSAMTEEILTLTDEEMILGKRQQIQALREELETLWEQQFDLEQAILRCREGENRLCA